MKNDFEILISSIQKANDIVDRGLNELDNYFKNNSSDDEAYKMRLKKFNEIEEIFSDLGIALQELEEIE